jgi:hypothetical protein
MGTGDPMRQLVIFLMFAVGVVTTDVVQAGAISISQVYLAGGPDAVGTSPYATDYVELFNPTGSPVDVSGWLVAYGGNNGTSSFGCAGCTGTIPPNTMIQPCRYLLVQVGPTSIAVGATLPPPDVVLASPSLLPGGGALALLSGGTAIGTCPSGPALQDLVGWGAVSCHLGQGASYPVDKALVRLGGGMSAIGNNSLDFTVADANPRNSSSTPNALCLASPTLKETWGNLKSMYR